MQMLQSLGAHTVHVFDSDIFCHKNLRGEINIIVQLKRPLKDVYERKTAQVGAR
jgi:hypothetical protein